MRQANLTKLAPAAAIAVTALLWAVNVLADSAQEHYERGMQHLEREDRTRALEEFTKAYALDPAPPTAAQLGMTEKALGMLPEAELHMKQALSAYDNPWVRKHHSTLAAELQGVALLLGTLEVHGGQPGDTLSINSQPPLDLPFVKPLRVKVGAVDLRIARGGHVAWLNFVLKASAKHIISVESLTFSHPDAASVHPSSVVFAQNARPRSHPFFYRSAAFSLVIGGTMALLTAVSYREFSREQDRACRGKTGHGCVDDTDLNAESWFIGGAGALGILLVNANVIFATGRAPNAAGKYTGALGNLLVGAALLGSSLQVVATGYEQSRPVTFGASLLAGGLNVAWGIGGLFEDVASSQRTAWAPYVGPTGAGVRGVF